MCTEVGQKCFQRKHYWHCHTAQHAPAKSANAEALQKHALQRTFVPGGPWPFPLKVSTFWPSTSQSASSTYKQVMSVCYSAVTDGPYQLQYSH